MVLEFQSRMSTKDVDALIAAPSDRQLVRRWIAKVADESGLPQEWLNDGAKAYLRGVSNPALLFASDGIRVSRPSFEQLLAMKLAAWRDEVDIQDARLLVRSCSLPPEADLAFAALEPFIPPPDRLKAKYAFLDVWEDLHGSA